MSQIQLSITLPTKFIICVLGIGLGLVLKSVSEVVSE